MDFTAPLDDLDITNSESISSVDIKTDLLSWTPYVRFTEEVLNEAGVEYETESFGSVMLNDLIHILEYNGFDTSSRDVTLFLSPNMIDEFVESFDITKPTDYQNIQALGVDVSVNASLSQNTGVLVHEDSIVTPTRTVRQPLLVKYPDGLIKITKEETETTEMTESKSYESPDDVLESNAELFKQKNEDYGSSWRLAGETMAQWAKEMDLDDIDPTDKREMVSLGLYFQRLHKITRAFNLEFGPGNPNNEPIAESHRDESTYAGIHTSFAMEPVPTGETGQYKKEDGRQ